MNLHERTAAAAPRKRGWRVFACVAQTIVIAVMAYPFWADALHGNTFHATPLALGTYGLLFLMTCGLLLFSIMTVAVPRAARLAARSMPAIMVLKWVAMLGGGWELFHNRMGLGMEILGPIPNYVIDGAIFLGAVGVAWTFRVDVQKCEVSDDSPRPRRVSPITPPPP
jgi:hypothetical protein